MLIAQERPELIQSARKTFGTKQVVDTGLAANFSRNMAEFANPNTQSSQHARQFLRAHGDQRDNANHYELTERKAEHR
jgi:hypothetical protein